MREEQQPFVVFLRDSGAALLRSPGASRKLKTEVTNHEIGR